jgi:hypothetical protein
LVIEAARYLEMVRSGGDGDVPPPRPVARAAEQAKAD